jgi:hypothetical protein
MATGETKGGSSPKNSEKRGGYPSAPRPAKIPPVPKTMPSQPKKKG